MMVQTGWGTISLPPGREGYHLFELYRGSLTSINLITTPELFLDSPRTQSELIMKFTSGRSTS